MLPGRISFAAEAALRDCPVAVYELRLIGGQCAFAVTSDGIRFLDTCGRMSAVPRRDALTVRQDELEEAVERAVGYSGFAHEDELRRCFLTRPDGTRMGIAFAGGGGSLNTGRVQSLNIRIPAAAAVWEPGVLERLLDGLSGGLLVAGAPNTGKTTLLRCCCRYLGGGQGGVYRKVCVIDERMELAGAAGRFDLGACTDVIAGRDKREAILTALRLFSPEVIVCDELGSRREAESVLEGLNSGVIFIASMHAGGLRQLAARSQFRALFDENVFETVAFLSSAEKGRLAAVYSRKEVLDEIRRGSCAVGRGADDGGMREPAQTAARKDPVEAV